LVVFVHRHYVKPLSAHKNHIFYQFGPYSTLIWPNSGQSGMAV